MRKFAAFVAVVLVGSFLVSGAAFGTTIYYGELNSFTSTTDANLDLNPATKVYAINIGSTSDVTVDNGVHSLTFKAEWPTGAYIEPGFESWSAFDNAVGGYDPNVTGTGASNLKTLLSTGRVTPDQGGTYQYSTFLDLTVTAGTTYDLQILLMEHYFDTAGTRGGNIKLSGSTLGNGVMLVEGYGLGSKTDAPLVYHMTFTAASTKVQVEMQRGVGFADNSGMINALTLSVPEPSTAALLTTGLLGLLAYAWRKRR